MNTYYYCGGRANGKSHWISEKMKEFAESGVKVTYLDTDLVQRMNECKRRVEEMDIHQDSLDSAVYWKSIMEPIILKEEKERLNMNYGIYKSMPELEKFCNENDIYWNVEFNDIVAANRFQFIHRPTHTIFEQFIPNYELSNCPGIQDKLIFELKRNLLNKSFKPFVKPYSSKPEIKKVIFNNPATIVFWSDGTKTVVKCENEEFDQEKGIAMAVAKKFLGTNKSHSNYLDIFKEWIRE